MAVLEETILIVSSSSVVLMFVQWNSAEESSSLQNALSGVYSDGVNAASYIRENVPEDSKKFITGVMQNGDYETLYQKCQSEEQANRSMLLEVEKKYPGITNEDDITNILNAARAKKASQKDGPTR